MNSTSASIQSLDGLRGLLALTVFVCHVYMGFIQPPNGEFTTANERWILVGRLAVVAFFVLSGFVITMSLAHNRARGFRIGEYALARVARIAPPLLAVIALTSVMAAILGMTGANAVSIDTAERMAYVTDAGEQLLAIVTLTLAGDLRGHGFNGPLWSLTYEIRFYVLAGLASMALWSPSPIKRALSLLAMLGWLCAIDIGAFFEGDAEQGTMLVSFALGAAAYRLRGIRDSAIVAVLIGGLAAAVVAGLAGRSSMPISLGPSHLWAMHYMMFAVIFACVTVVIARTGRFAALSSLAGSSYTLYILHFPVLQFFYFIAFNVDLRLAREPWNWAMAGASAATAFAICRIVAFYVERPETHRAWIAARLRRRSASSANATAR